MELGAKSIPFGKKYLVYSFLFKTEQVKSVLIQWCSTLWPCRSDESLG